MALRQREWAIFIRPYYLQDTSSGKPIRINYEGVPKAGRRSDLGDKDSDDIATPLLGVGEGMKHNSTLPYDEGGWVMWYKTTSFVKLREKYKECLTQVGKEMTRVVEIIPVDILVTPLS